MAVISIINQKGGCGKTTTAVNLSMGLVKRGYRVLLIDMDPQGHATLGLGFNPDSLRQTIFDVIDARDVEVPINSVLLDVSERMNLAPANVFLSAFEQSMSGKAWRESRLSKAIFKIRSQYDYIVVDCPPSLGLLTVNALLASTHVMVPIDTGYYSLAGVKKLSETLEMLKSKVDHELAVHHLITFYDTKSPFNKEFLSDLRKAINPEAVFKQKIRRSTKFNSSQRIGKSVIELGSKKCGIAFHDYFNLTQEVITWTKGTQNYKITMLRANKTSIRTKNLKPINFNYKGSAEKVYVAGEFNNWQPQPMKKHGSAWETTFKLNPGDYEYKFVVDGEWVTDPHNKDTKTRGHIVNSVVSVR
jgi:chromosome partitioning protein